MMTVDLINKTLYNTTKKFMLSLINAQTSYVIVFHFSPHALPTLNIPVMQTSCIQKGKKKDKGKGSFFIKLLPTYITH